MECRNKLRRRRFGSFQPLQAHFYVPWSTSRVFSVNPSYCSGCPGATAVTFFPPTSKESRKNL
jgi:hypothetical protein